MVKTKLEKFKIHKSCGPDGMNPHLIQKTAKTMCIPHMLIFQKSLKEGECPKDQKSANATPIHKKGDRTEPSNYRPVSLTSQVCKVLEKSLKNRS